MMEDGISLLPDCSLVEIISRLDSTEEVIRTCILSKRWKHLWTQVPILNLTLKPYSVDEDRRIPEFISYVKKVVSQRGQSRLNKFVLSMPYDSSNESIVSKLIRYAVTCNVQDLYLFLVDPYDVNPEFVKGSEFFFNLEFLITFEIGWLFNCVIMLLVSLSLSNAEELRLDYSMGVLSSKAKKEEMLKGHILSLRHVKKLKIGHYCLKTLARLEAKGFTFPSNMKYLDLSDNDKSETDTADTTDSDWSDNED
ncbi:F-box protein-like protein [Tanacetum coccineum]